MSLKSLIKVAEGKNAANVSFEDKFLKEYEEAVKREELRERQVYPSNYFRPSSMYGCERMLFFQRVHSGSENGDQMEPNLSAEKMVRALIKRGHEAMLEHYSFSVLFICDRGVSHELVRHRIASFAQESTRYCNYGKSGEVAFIRPVFFPEGSIEFDNWCDTMMGAERDYLALIEKGRSPQEARCVLPNSLKTEIVVTANLREWRHFFKLRAVGVTGAPHPQMREVTVPLLKELRERVPIIFDDLILPEEAEKCATGER